MSSKQRVAGSNPARRAKVFRPAETLAGRQDGVATALTQQITEVPRYPAGMAPRTPRAPADTDARHILELLRHFWMLALRADGKSAAPPQRPPAAPPAPAATPPSPRAPRPAAHKSLRDRPGHHRAYPHPGQPRIPARNRDHWAIENGLHQVGKTLRRSAAPRRACNFRCVNSFL
jgi:hypothetical protein